MGPQVTNAPRLTLAEQNILKQAGVQKEQLAVPTIDDNGWIESAMPVTFKEQNGFNIGYSHDGKVTEIKPLKGTIVKNDFNNDGKLDETFLGMSFGNQIDNKSRVGTSFLDASGQKHNRLERDFTPFTGLKPKSQNQPSTDPKLPSVTVGNTEFVDTTKLYE